MRLQGPRIPCLVPFCKRTAPAEKYEGCEIICAKHWRLISRETKARKRHVERVHAKASRRHEQACAQQDAARAARLGRVLERTAFACHAAWAKCKQEAIEASAGIA